MFENIMSFFKKFAKKHEVALNSKDAAKERLHLVLMQDRANVSADFLDLMRQEIIDVIKKYIEVDENAIDVRLTNKENADGTNGAPALYANIPIVNIKEEAKKAENKIKKEPSNSSENSNKPKNSDNKEKNNKKDEEEKDKEVKVNSNNAENKAIDNTKEKEGNKKQNIREQPTQEEKTDNKKNKMNEEAGAKK